MESREGGMFPKAKWQYYDVNDPTRPRIVRSVRAWDLATTEGDGDWTVGTKMGVAVNGDLYLLDVKRFRKGHSRDVCPMDEEGFYCCVEGTVFGPCEGEENGNSCSGCCVAAYQCDCSCHGSNR